MEWDTASLSIGQGAIAVTPVQMVVMTSAVANGGLPWTRDDTLVLWTFQTAAHTLSLTPTTTGSDTVFILDPSQLDKVDYRAMALNNLAKTGTADNRQLVWYGGARVKAWPKCGAIVDVDITEDMVP